MFAIDEATPSGQNTLPACLFGENSNGLGVPRRTWSLLEMVRYAVRDLHALLLWIDHMANFTQSQQHYRIGTNAELSAGERKTVRQQLECLRKHCSSLEITDGLGVCDELAKALEGTIDLSGCRAYLVSIRRMLTDAMESRAFMYVPASVAKYARSCQAPYPIIPATIFSSPSHLLTSRELADMPLGKRVYQAFPKARFDGQQMAVCIIAGASTATVFHLMRIVEWGVRALGHDLGIKRVKDILKPKPGGRLLKPVVRFTPIEHLPWEKLHSQLRVKVDKRLSHLRPGPSKDAKQRFYGSVLHDFHNFKDAWRNHVMHTRDEFGEAEAMRVLSYVERFMDEIASHISPVP